MDCPQQDCSHIPESRVSKQDLDHSVLQSTDGEPEMCGLWTVHTHTPEAVSSAEAEVYGLWSLDCPQHTHTPESRVSASMTSSIVPFKALAVNLKLWIVNIRT